MAVEFHVMPAKGSIPVATFKDADHAIAYVEAREHTVPGLTVREVKTSSRQVYPSPLRLVEDKRIAAISSKGAS